MIIYGKQKIPLIKAKLHESDVEEINKQIENSSETASLSQIIDLSSKINQKSKLRDVKYQNKLTQKVYYLAEWIERNDCDLGPFKHRKISIGVLGEYLYKKKIFEFELDTLEFLPTRVFTLMIVVSMYYFGEENIIKDFFLEIVDSEGKLCVNLKSVLPEEISMKISQLLDLNQDIGMWLDTTVKLLGIVYWNTEKFEPCAFKISLLGIYFVRYSTKTNFSVQKSLMVGLRTSHPSKISRATGDLTLIETTPSPLVRRSRVPLASAQLWDLWPSIW